MKKRTGNMNILTRKNGIGLCVIGIAIFLLNFLTYSLWEIDIDILGAMIFVLGLILVIASGPSMKNSSELLSRRNGVWVCIIAVLMTAILAYSPFPALNGDITGFVGLGLFVLGMVLITVRWKY
jgi:magnesium-transporting ATPase (P-type)